MVIVPTPFKGRECRETPWRSNSQAHSQNLGKRKALEEGDQQWHIGEVSMQDSRERVRKIL